MICDPACANMYVLPSGDLLASSEFCLFKSYVYIDKQDWPKSEFCLNNGTVISPVPRTLGFHFG